MSHIQKINGSVLLVTIFIVALFSTVVIGMLQINTQETQIMRNQIYAAQALAIAEAGLSGNSTLETDEIEVTLTTLVAKRW